MATTPVSYVPREVAASAGYNISQVLATVSIEAIEETYVDSTGFMGGHISYDHDFVRFQDGGIKLLYETQPGMSAKAYGAPDSNAAYSGPDNQMAFNNLVFRQGHLNTVASPGRYDGFSADIINDPTELAKLVNAVVLDSVKDERRVRDLLFTAGRQGILGEIKAVGTVTDVGALTQDNTSPFTGVTGITPAVWTGYYTLSLRLGGHTNEMAFQKGRDFQVCAAPADWATTRYAAITTTRNWSVPGRVLANLVETPNGINPATGLYDGGYFQITLAFPYTLTSDGSITAKATVKTAVDLIAAGDVITMWGGILQGPSAAFAAVTSASTLPMTGPNCGMCGIPFWMSTADIEDVSGAAFKCEIPVANEFVSISRRNAAFDYLVPQLQNLAGGALTWNAILSVISNVTHKRGDKPMGTEYSLFCHPFVVRKLISLIGSEQVKQNSQLTAERETWFAKYGATGVVLQDPDTAMPLNIGRTRHIPLDMLPIMDPRDLRQIAPGPSKWIDNGSGGYVHPVYINTGSAGAAMLTNRFQMTRLSHSQMFMRNAFKNGAVTQFSFQ